MRSHQHLVFSEAPFKKHSQYPLHQPDVQAATVLKGRVTSTSWNVRLMCNLSLLRLSDKRPDSPVALGLVPAEVRSEPAALRLQSLLNVSIVCQELKTVSFSLVLLNSFFFFFFLSFIPLTHFISVVCLR